MTGHPNQNLSPSQKILLQRQQVQLGHSVRIKGDEEALRQLEETVHSLMEKKLRQAEQQAKLIIEEAVGKAQQQAKQVLENVRQQAQALEMDATTRRDDVLEEAYAEGFEKGFAQGYQDATQKVETETVQLLESAQTLLNGAYQAERFVLRQFESDALKLVQYIAERVLGQEMTTAPETVAHMIQHAADNLYLTGRVRVVLGHEALALIRQYTAGSAEALAAMSRFELLGDPQMDHQDIFILANEGAFSIGPSAQINTLITPLQDQLSLPRPNPDDIAADITDNLKTEIPSSSANDNLINTNQKPFDQNLTNNLAFSVEAAQFEGSDASTSEYIAFDDLAFEAVTFDDDPPPAPETKDFVFEEFQVPDQNPSTGPDRSPTRALNTDDLLEILDTLAELETPLEMTDEANSHPDSPDASWEH